MLPMQGAQVQSLVRELDPACSNEDSLVPHLRPSTAKKSKQVQVSFVHKFTCQ